MSLQDFYLPYVTKKLIDEYLEAGDSPSTSELRAALTTYQEDHDLSQAQFKADDWEVENGEASSAQKYNDTMQVIYDDLVVSYQYLFSISSRILDLFDRWSAEGLQLSKELDQILVKVSALVEAEKQGIDGVTCVGDTFADCSLIDFTRSALVDSSTTARVDTRRKTISIHPVDKRALSQQFTDSIPTKNITFSVLSKSYVSSVVAAPNSRPEYIFDGLTTYWQQRVYTTKPIPVSAELKIDLEEKIYLSRVEIDLHASNSGSPIQVLPFYSTNGRNWVELVPDQPAQSLVDRGTFLFPRTELRYIKFFFIKNAWDTHTHNFYIYEFGIDNICFFDEELSTDQTSEVLISRVLYSLDPLANEAREFNSLSFEACEFVPEHTAIDYYVAASNDITHPVATCQWVQVDPLQRTNATRPTEVAFGDLTDVELSGVGISFNAFGAQPELVNPSPSFTLRDTSSSASVVASGQRYAFKNKEDRILNYSLTQTIPLVTSSLEVWRNVNTKGSTLLVRGVANGWGKEDAYYTAHVWVGNTMGAQVDFGPQPIILDEASRSGKVFFSYGRHTIKVHKDNWSYVSDSGVTTLAALRTADRLYPYNHRYLVEGFNYPATWPNYVEKAYMGFDIVAQTIMQRVGVFDILESCEADDYSKFALDWDAADPSRAGTSNKSETQVFLLKVDAEQVDFLNEKFLIKFKTSTTRYKYLRLRAILRTTDSGVSPSLSSYKIKLGGL